VVESKRYSSGCPSIRLRGTHDVPVLVLGDWGDYWSALQTNSIAIGTILTSVLNVTQNNRLLAIETKPPFLISYLIFLSAIFIAHGYPGFSVKEPM
jgi:hypothetical protein